MNAHDALRWSDRAYCKFYSSYRVTRLRRAYFLSYLTHMHGHLLLPGVPLPQLPCLWPGFGQERLFPALHVFL
jgi:hypothetical protein